MTSPHHPLTVGSRFGPYRLDRLIGRGGMGEVYQAYDTVKDRTVAIKVLPERPAQDPMYRQRFQRESHAAARLREAHVIPIHDCGEIDGRLFIDMRLLAPERFAATELTPAADVYALACVLYECLPGVRPFTGANDAQIMRAHLFETPPRPSRVRASVPATFDPVIARGLAKSPQERYPSAGAPAAAALGFAGWAVASKHLLRSGADLSGGGAQHTQPVRHHLYAAAGSSGERPERRSGTAVLVPAEFRMRRI